MKGYLQLLVIVILFTSIACSKTSIIFELPKDELQKKLKEKFPLKPGSEEKSPVDLTVSNPVVILEEGKNQIGLQVNIDAEPSTEIKEKLPTLPKAPEKGRDLPLPKPGPGPKELPLPQAKPLPPAPKPHFTGSAIVFASVSYDPAIKAIRLSDPKITKLEITQLPEPLTKPLKEMAEKTMSQKFAEKPIPIENKTELEKITTSFLKSVTVKDGKLLIEIGW